MSIDGIIVIAEHRDGIISDGTLEAIGAGRTLADSLSGKLAVLVVSDSPETASLANLAGVDLILHAKDSPEEFDPVLYETAAKSVIEQHKPRAVLIPHSVNGMGFAPALAAAIGAGLATDVFDVAVEGNDVVATRSGYGGKVAMEVVFPERSLAVLTLRGASFTAPTESGTADVETISYEEPAQGELTEHIEFVHQPQSGIDISSSDVIVSIGRGIGDKDMVAKFAEFADRIGATLGCSRPVVDAGWLPKPHQVGQSGTVAKSCSVYLAFGISGAAQHQFGMKHVDRIIAVNTDSNAPIFSIAELGATVDAVELVDALLAEIGTRG